MNFKDLKPYVTFWATLYGKLVGGGPFDGDIQKVFPFENVLEFRAAGSGIHVYNKVDGSNPQNPTYAYAGIRKE